MVTCENQHGACILKFNITAYGKVYFRQTIMFFIYICIFHVHTRIARTIVSIYIYIIQCLGRVIILYNIYILAEVQGDGLYY